MSRTNRYGFSLVEIILSSALFILLVTALVGGYLYGQESTVLSGKRARAVFLAEEGLEAVRNIRDDSFLNLTDGTHGLAVTGNVWAFSSSSDITDIYTREITVSSVDSDRKEITSTVTWKQNEQRNGLVTLITRLANWLSVVWTQTTKAEFDSGKFNSTESTSTAGGEVQLEIEGLWNDADEHLLLNLSGGANAEALFQGDNIMWIARADQTLYKYDTADISRNVLTELDTYAIGTNTPTGVFIYEGKAYISTTGGNEVVIIDLATDTIDATINLSGNADATDIVVANNTLLVTRKDNGGAELYVYDLTGSTLLGVVDVGGDVNAIVADDSYAYLATEDSSELWVVNYNSCTGGGGGNECVVIAQYNPTNGGGSDATAITKMNNTLYLGRDNNYIHSLDVTNPFSISQNFDIDPGNDTVLDIAVDENVGFIYATTDDGNSEELNIIRISDLALFDVNLDGGSDANAIFKQGAYLYIASDSANEIHVLKGGKGGWESLKGLDIYSTQGGDDARNVFVSGSYAYVGTDDDFYVLNITNPNNITYEDHIDFNFDINDVYVSGSYAYLATDDNQQELTIVDVSDPSNIIEIDSLDTNGGQNGLAIWVEGTTAYLGTQNNNGTHIPCIQNGEFYILDVTTPTAPVCIGSYNVGGNVNDIQVVGTTAYLATDSNSQDLLILDITAPASISKIGSYNGPANWNGLHHVGNTIYGAADDSGGDPDFFVIDITTPTTPTVLASHDTGDQNNDVRASGDYAFLATNDNDEGLTVLDISNASLGIITQVSAYDTGSDCNGIDFDSTNVHVACEHFVREYQIVGKSASPTNFSFTGWFTSVPFNSTANNTSWSILKWSESGTGTIQFRLRTAPDFLGNPGTWTEWLGPTTANDFYTQETGETINTSHSDGINDQWIQYRVYFSGNGITTPILEDIAITYE